MNPNKALDPDSFSVSFFQSYWGLIGNSVVDACLRFLNGGDDLHKLNHVHVVLIPKVKFHVEWAIFDQQAFVMSFKKLLLKF